MVIWAIAARSVIRMPFIRDHLQDAPVAAAQLRELILCPLPEFGVQSPADGLDQAGQVIGQGVRLEGLAHTYKVTVVVRG